MGEKAVIFW